MNNRFAIAACAASLVAPCISLAADDLAAVVVTATRSEVPIERALADVSVVTAAQIARSGHQSVIEVLASLPGVEVSANGGPGQTASVFLRGANSAQTAVLIDGVRQTNLNFGSASLQSIPLASVERIEVLRGGGSSLYGAGALGGVIQIFTKKGAGPIRGSAELGFGDYGRSRFAGSVQGSTTGGFSFSLGASRDTATGPSATLATNAFNFDPDSDSSRIESMAVRLGQELSQGHSVDFSHSVGRNATKFDFVLPPAKPEAMSTQRLATTALTLRNEFTPYWTSVLRLGSGEDRIQFSGTAPAALFGLDDIVKTTNKSISWQNDLDTNYGRFRLGIESEKQQLASEASTYRETTRNTRAMLLGYEIESDQHIGRVNFRRDVISGYRNALSWDAAYGYKLNKHWMSSVRLKRAFRAPSFNDMYFNDPTGFWVPNPNLRPEVGRTGEFELAYAGVSRRASLTVFENRITDLNTFVCLGAFCATGGAVNVGAARIRGAIATYRESWGTWTLKGDFTQQSAKDLTNGQDLARRARHYGNLGLEHNGGNWHAGVEVSEHGARYDSQPNALANRTAAYALLNLYGTVNLGADWQAFARWNNVLGEKYEIARTFDTMGSNIFVGIRYTPR